MRHRYSLTLSLLVFAVLFIALALVTHEAHPTLASSSTRTLRQQPARVNSLVPLPHDCDGFTPPDHPIPVCCVTGYVYYASPMSVETTLANGAVVTLTTEAGVITTTLTAPGIHNAQGEAYYQFNLQAAGVAPGEWITITASYLEKRHQTTYQVAPGGQQVDVVLAETRNLTFDPVTVIVDEQSLAATPTDPGVYVTGTVQNLSEAACGPGSEFWDGAIYAGDTTDNGVGPATIEVTYRPPLMVSGVYEIFAYSPYGCSEGTPRYVIHIDGQPVATTLVDQRFSGMSQGEWISLGLFEFPAGTESYISVDNVTGKLDPKMMAFDALKWELRAPFPPAIKITIDDDVDKTTDPDSVGFYRNIAPNWYERPAANGCDHPSITIESPIYWLDHIHQTYTKSSGDPENWARWRPNLPVAGAYDLYAYIPVCYADADVTRYWIYADGQPVDIVSVNQMPHGGVWAYVGQYDFPAGTSSYVYLDDVSGDDLDMLAFDALRWELRAPFAPVATIRDLSASTTMAGEFVTLYGWGQDTDGDGKDIVAYEWRSNLDGLLATTATFTVPAESLAVGLHTLTFRVQDDEGLWSAPVSRTLEVLSAPPPESWHMMLYLAGDNNLSSHLSTALYQLQQIALPENITVTVWFDRLGTDNAMQYVAWASSGGWQSTSLGEINTGVSNTLASYIRWAQTEYPADHYYLAVADHGRGIQGTGWDDTNSGDYLELWELRQALHVGTQNGTFKIDVLHLDACLMAMLEVAYEVWPYTDYVIASENLAWTLFDYTGYVQALGQKTPRAFAMAVAERYHTRMGSYPNTISVLDSKYIVDVVNAVDNLAQILITTLPTETVALESALSQVQRFDSQDYGKITAEDEFVDLRHLADLLVTTSDTPGVQQAAYAVLTATQRSQVGVTTTIAYEAHHSGSYAGIWLDLENANGLAIYYPPNNRGWDYDYYLSPALRLSHDTRWDELLARHLGPVPTPGPIPMPTPPEPLEMLCIYLPVLLRGE